MAHGTKNPTNAAHFGASLFNSNKQTIDCLMYFILKRDLSSIQGVLEGKIASHQVPIGEGVCRQLNDYNQRYSNINETPICLAMLLSTNASSRNPATPHVAPTDVVAKLRENSELLKRYTQLNGLKNPNDKQIEQFIATLANNEQISAAYSLTV